MYTSNIQGIIHHQDVELPENFLNPTHQQLSRVFDVLFEGHDISQDLRHWGEVIDDDQYPTSNAPHWLLTKNGFRMHVDDADETPPYVHCLKVFVDNGHYAMNQKGGELKFSRGSYYVFNCKEPHAIEIRKDEVTEHDRDLFNFSIVMDSYELIEPEIAINKCIEFGLSKDFNEDLMPYIDGRREPWR